MHIIESQVNFKMIFIISLLSFHSGMYDSLSVINDGLAVTLDLLDDYEKQWEYHPG